MSTYEFCETYVKPAAMKQNCCFTDLLIQTDCPEEWLGEMTVFVSHWRVSKTVVSMLFDLRPFQLNHTRLLRYGRAGGDIGLQTW